LRHRDIHFLNSKKSGWWFEFTYIQFSVHKN